MVKDICYINGVTLREWTGQNGPFPCNGCGKGTNYIMDDWHVYAAKNLNTKYTDYFYCVSCFKLLFNIDSRIRNLFV